MRPGVPLAGVVLNRIGSDGHLQATAEAIKAATGLPVLGSLPDDPAIAVPERHLGLVTASEGGMPLRTVDRLADLVIERFDLAALWRIASAAPPLSLTTSCVVDPVHPGARIAVAQDRAFGFYYQDTIDLLRECGADITPFSPLDDEALPPGIDGLYLGGGFPELYARELARNSRMRDAVRAHARAGKPIYAECGGLMALGQTLSTFDGETLPMFGLLPVASRMQRQTLTIGYREVEALRPSPLMAAGTRVRGHEFHWSVADAQSESVAAYRVSVGDRLATGAQLEGFCIGSTLASYVHLNLAGKPELARRFVASCARSPV
jgi:cobyrinic acid a,c-diamide synthase